MVFYKISLQTTFMKQFFILLTLLFSEEAFSQKFEILKDVNIDSSYIVLCMGQGYDKTFDSLERFGFILDKPEQILELKQGLNLKRKAQNIIIDKNSIDIGIVQNKKLIRTEGVFYPMQGKFLTNGKGWYYFDTAFLVKLHLEHPLKYHSEKFSFDTYLNYSFFKDSIENVSSFLYLDEPNLKYEGKFSLIVKKNPETSSSIFAEIDLKKELALLISANKFHTYSVMNDKFNIDNKDKVEIIIECPKYLYDKYSNKENIKGKWQPNLIEAKVYFKD